MTILTMEALVRSVLICGMSNIAAQAFTGCYSNFGKTSEDCLQANRNVPLCGRSRRTEQTADANKARAFERGVWTDNDGVHGSSLLSAWPITPASLVPFKFIHAATTLK